MSPPPGNDQTQQAIDQQQAAPVAPSTVQSCPDVLSWIEVHLLDMEGNPVGGKQYAITTPDGNVSQGTLDSSGKVRLDGIKPGACDICFPDLDKDAWEPI